MANKVVYIAISNTKQQLIISTENPKCIYYANETEARENVYPIKLWKVKMFRHV